VIGTVKWFIAQLVLRACRFWLASLGAGESDSNAPRRSRGCLAVRHWKRRCLFAWGGGETSNGRGYRMLTVSEPQSLVTTTGHGEPEGAAARMGIPYENVVSGRK